MKPAIDVNIYFNLNNWTFYDNNLLTQVYKQSTTYSVGIATQTENKAEL